MSDDPRTSWLRGSVVGYLLGVGVTLATALVEFNWRPLVTAVARADFDRQANWLKAIFAYVWWIPVLVGVGLLVLRLTRGSKISVLWYALGAVTPYVALLAYLLLGPSIENQIRSRPFQSAGWRANDDTSDVMWPTRLRMVDDLLERELLAGLSRDSVVRMLGPADSSTIWKEWDMTYYLGPERGFLSIDSETLAIRLRNDTVVEARLVRD